MFPKTCFLISPLEIKDGLVKPLTLISGITMSLLLLLSAFPVLAQTPTTVPPPTPTVDPQTLLVQALQTDKDAGTALSSANQAMNTVNLLLSFIQIFGLLIAIVTAIAAIFGLTSITQFRQRMQNELTERAQELAEAQNELRLEKDRTFQAMAEARSRAEAELAVLAGQVSQIREASSRATRALALMQLGEQQLDLNNRKGARQLYENAFEVDPDNPAINYFLGELLIHERDLDRGMQLLSRAQQLSDKPYAPVEAAIAYGLRLQGERATDEADRDLLYARAVKQFQYALTIDRNVLNLLRESFHGSLAGLYKRQKKYDLAIQSYERAHEITPQSSYPVINLANLHYWRGNTEIALTYYQQSERNADVKLARNPLDIWARMNRVVARLVLGNVAGAKSDVDELDPLVTQGHVLVRDLSRIISDLNLLHESPKPPDQIEWFDGAFSQLMQRLEHASSPH